MAVTGLYDVISIDDRYPSISFHLLLIAVNSISLGKKSES
jgi:hypothetical protein